MQFKATSEDLLNKLKQIPNALIKVNDGASMISIYYQDQHDTQILFGIVPDLGDPSNFLLDFGLVNNMPELDQTTEINAAKEITVMQAALQVIKESV